LTRRRTRSIAICPVRDQSTGRRNKEGERERVRTYEMSSSLFLASHFFKMMFFNDPHLVMISFKSFGVEVREGGRREQKGRDKPADFRGGSMYFHQTFITDFNQIHNIFPPKNHTPLVIERIKFGVVISLPDLCFVIERKNSREGSMSLWKTCEEEEEEEN
jgi:hypothetical protein